MKRESRTAVYDRALGVEAYRFRGLSRPFPNHFHEHYVIGLVEEGRRILTCRNQTYVIEPGTLLLFSPGDSHGCIENGGALDYRGLNLSRETVLELAEEAVGWRGLPDFAANVLLDQEAACRFQLLHERVMSGTEGLGKEEGLLQLFARLFQICGQRPAPFPRKAVEQACAFMERRLGQRVTLDQLCREAGLSRSALLRAFAKEKGVTPYRYLENLRISEARKLLEQGVPPAEAALRTGFSDQSHFTNCFSRFIGLSPGAYQDIFRGRGADRPNRSEREERRRSEWT